MTNLKVLVVDDTILYRKIVSDILAEIPGVTVVGSAGNGNTALHRIASLKPDLITLDIEMPQMNGIQVLEHIRQEKIEASVIMVSTLTVKGGEMTIRALELGAFDFITKPQSGKMEENIRSVSRRLKPVVEMLLRRKSLTENRYGKASDLPDRKESRTVKAPKPIVSSMPKSRSEIVAIGISTGGPNALAQMMPRLPADINVPVLIVQHMPPVFTLSLAKSLNEKCALTVKEAENGEILKPNVVFIAPGGKQMKITAHADGKNRLIKITDDPPVNSCKPSVDYLFDSIASHYIGRATGVIMTGMGSDGAAGLKKMQGNGASVIAQDRASCTVYGMPKEPVESGTADIVVPLDRIADEIVKTIK